MKGLYLIIAYSLFFLNVNGQKDEKRIREARIAVDQHKDYNKALSLLNKVSEEGQKNADYQLYFANINEQAGDFDQAVKAYKQYLSYNPSDSSASAKIISLNRKIDIRKNCPKCKGDGFFIVETYCTSCLGLSEMIIPCPKCRGQKSVECSACYGTGRALGSANSTEICSRCGGTGKKECVRCNSTGSVTEICKYCKGGVIRQKVKCTAHE